MCTIGLLNKVSHCLFLVHAAGVAHVTRALLSFIASHPDATQSKKHSHGSIAKPWAKPWNANMEDGCSAGAEPPWGNCWFEHFGHKSKMHLKCCENAAIPKSTRSFPSLCMFFLYSDMSCHVFFFSSICLSCQVALVVLVVFSSSSLQGCPFWP